MSAAMPGGLNGNTAYPRDSLRSSRGLNF